MCDRSMWGAWVEVADALARRTGMRLAVYRSDGHFKVMWVGDPRWQARKDGWTTVLQMEAERAKEAA